MSGTDPVISGVVVTPALAVSVTVARPSVAVDGWVVRVTPATTGTPVPVVSNPTRVHAHRAGITFARCHSFAARGAVADVEIGAVRGGVTSWSDAVSVTASCVTSRPATVRARVLELLDAIVAARVVGTFPDATVLQDLFGRAQSFEYKDSAFGERCFPLVEVGLAHAASEVVESTGVRSQEVVVPVRVFVLAGDLDAGCEQAAAVAELLRCRLLETPDLGLNTFGVQEGSVRLSVPDKPARSPDGKVCAARFEVSASVVYDETTPLW
jgi:hypothetical protein